jgi:hypothetical protein
MVCFSDSWRFLDVLAVLNLVAYVWVHLPQLPVVGTFIAACNFAIVAVMALLSVNPDWVPDQALPLVALLAAFVVFFYWLLNASCGLASGLAGGLLAGPIAISQRTHVHEWLARHAVDLDDAVLIAVLLLAILLGVYLYGIARNNLWLQLLTTNAVFAFLFVITARAFVIRQLVISDDSLCCGKGVDDQRCPFVFNWWMILLLCVAFVLRLAVSARVLVLRHRKRVLQQHRELTRKSHKTSASMQSQSEREAYEAGDELETQPLLPVLRSVPESLREST